VGLERASDPTPSLKCLTSLVQLGDSNDVSPAADEVGILPVAYNRSGGLAIATPAYPSILAPNGDVGGDFTGVLRLPNAGGAAALMYSRAVRDTHELLSFHWYLCSRSYTGEDGVISLAAARAEGVARRAACRRDCGAWCNTTRCEAACCPAAANGNSSAGLPLPPSCAACTATCGTLCASCTSQCDALQLHMQTARVDLYSADMSRMELVSQVRDSVLSPTAPPCEPGNHCNTTLLSPKTLGVAGTQCGWQVFVLPLAAFINKSIVVSGKCSMHCMQRCM
jgi:hypothetical protein